MTISKGYYNVFEALEDNPALAGPGRQSFGQSITVILGTLRLMNGAGRLPETEGSFFQIQPG